MSLIADDFVSNLYRLLLVQICMDGLSRFKSFNTITIFFLHVLKIQITVANFFLIFVLNELFQSNENNKFIDYWKIVLPTSISHFKTL